MVWNSKTYTICVINTDISISSFNSWYIGYRQGWRKVINSGEGLNSQQENFSIWWKLNPIGELLKWGGGGLQPLSPPFPPPMVIGYMNMCWYLLWTHIVIHDNVYKITKILPHENIRLYNTFDSFYGYQLTTIMRAISHYSLLLRCTDTLSTANHQTLHNLHHHCTQ